MGSLTVRNKRYNDELMFKEKLFVRNHGYVYCNDKFLYYIVAECFRLVLYIQIQESL